MTEGTTTEGSHQDSSFVLNFATTVLADERVVTRTGKLVATRRGTWMS